MINKMRNWLAVVVMVVVALGTLGITSPAAAQQPTSQTQLEMYGIISAINGKVLTVNGYSVDTTRAEVRGALAVGTLVKVEGTVNASVISARQVLVSIRTPRAGLFEISGVLSSLSNTTGVVAGVTINLSNAQFYRGVTVGTQVKVEGRFNAAGVLVAREIKPFAGTLDDSSDDSSVDDSSDDSSVDDSSDDSSDDDSSDDSSDDDSSDDSSDDDSHKGGDDKGGDDKGDDD